MKIAFAEPTPSRILILAGDVLHNLRGALDHLYWDLAHARLNPKPTTEKEKRGLQFPIFEDAKGYGARQPEIGRLGQDVLNVFDALKPYKGGNDSIWRLNRLSNIDKHRALLTAALHSHKMRIFKQAPTPPVMPVGDTEAPAEYVTVAITTPFPLKDGDVIMTGETETESHHQLNYTYGVAFNEPGVAEGTEIIGTLADLVNVADDIVNRLRPFV